MQKEWHSATKPLNYNDDYDIYISGGSHENIEKKIIMFLDSCHLLILTPRLFYS